MFQFTVHPAYVSVTDGIQTAARYMGVSWRQWLPLVVLSGLAEGILYGTLIGDTGRWYYVDRYTGRMEIGPGLEDRVPGILLGFALIVVVSLVLSWILMGIAVAGLRNRPLTVPWILDRGLRSLAAAILIALAVTAGILVVVALVIAAPPLGIIAAVFGFVGLIYVAMRWQFAMFTIFDGAGAIEGISESWRLSQGSVLRIFGWGLMGGLIAGAFNLATGLLSAPLAISSEIAVEQAVTSGVAEAGAVLVTFMTAVLYESERARKDPNLFPAPPPSAQFAPGWPQPGPYTPVWPGPYPPAALPEVPPAWPGTPDQPE